MTRRNTLFVPLAALTLAVAVSGMPKASAQNQSILAEVYGRGVHAFYAGQMDTAYNYLSSAINGGTRDPRAYYFRGIVAYNQGRVVEAETDWNQGATMEAQAGGAAGVGRSLSRFQGSGRLKLEQIRQEARLQAMLNAAERSDARRTELGLDTAAPSPPSPPAAAPAPPAPNNPFADDAGPAMATGEPTLESDDAMAGLDDNPFKDDPIAPGTAPAAPAPAAGGNPFGGPAPAAGDNPFGDSASPASNADDPFAAPAGDDPFGNPFE